MVRDQTGFDLNSTWRSQCLTPAFLPHAGGELTLTRGAKRLGRREVSQRVQGIIGKEPRDVSGDGGVENLAKHHCLVVWSDPPWRTDHPRLISPSNEQGSKGELAVPWGPCHAPSYRLGIDIVPWAASGGLEVMKEGWEWRGGSSSMIAHWGWWERMTHRDWQTLCKRQLIDNGESREFQWMRRLLVREGKKHGLKGMMESGNFNFFLLWLSAASLSALWVQEEWCFSGSSKHQLFFYIPYS